jgi:hypothetical protein
MDINNFFVFFLVFSCIFFFSFYYYFTIIVAGMARWTIEGLRNGVVYAIQGIRITVKNPALHNEKFLRVFIYLSIMSFVLYGVSYILVTIPIQFIQSYWWIVQAEDVGGREERLESIRETIDEVVASIPLLGLMFMRHFYSKPLDGLFMESLRYLDTVYPQRPAYYAPLVQLKKQKNYKDDLKIYVKRWWIKLRMGLAILILSYTPFIGQFMFPLAGKIPY